MRLKKAVRLAVWMPAAAILLSCQSQAASAPQPVADVTVVISSSPIAAQLPQLSADNPWPLLEQRPIELQPPPPSSGDCPLETGIPINAAYGPAIGPGPVYAVGFGSQAILTFVGPANAGGNQFSGSDWGGQKVLWVVSPVYSGPVLIRGRQIGGPLKVRFGPGGDPAAELHIDNSPATSSPDWRNLPSFTRLRSPGCYEYQVDGLNFSEWISFRAEEASN